MSMTRWLAPLALLALAAVGCLPESVETVVLTPTSPELEQVLLAADARWEAAGVDPGRIQIGPGGAPVRLVPERCGGIREGLCIAETKTHKQGAAFRGVRWMELYAVDVNLATHEMGHALGIDYHPDQDPEVHPEGAEACAPGAEGRPLMCAAFGHTLTASDLGDACAVGACGHLTAEL